MIKFDENPQWKIGIMPYSWLPKNQILTWHGTDTPESFKSNTNQAYNSTDISYALNNYGFRTGELDSLLGQKVDIALGCSFTEGIGLPINEVWPTLISAKSKYPMINLGLGGASSDTVARVLTNVCELYDIQSVYILWPESERFETVTEYTIASITPSIADASHAWYMSNPNAVNRFSKNSHIVHLLASTYKFNIYEQRMHTLLALLPEFGMPFARDGAHFGKRMHEEIANRFMQPAVDTIYVNGDSHSCGHDAGGKEFSYGRALATKLNCKFICDAVPGGGNDRVIRTTRDYLRNNKPKYLVIGWSTWEREEWVHNGITHNIACGIDINDLPPDLHQSYKEWVINSDTESVQIHKERAEHEKIWNFHLELEELGIKHLFFNAHHWFHWISCDKHDIKNWNKNFINPYSKEATYYTWCQDNGYTPSNPRYYHYGPDAHIAWADFLLPKLREL